MYKCKFDFTHENCWFQDVSKQFSKHEFFDNAAYVKPDGNLMNVCFVKGNSKDFYKILNYLRSHKTTKNVKTIDHGTDYLFLQVIGNKETMDFTTPVTSKCGCFRMNAVVGKNGKETWTVGAPRKTDINNLLSELKKHGKILNSRVSKTPVNIANLTQKQKTALELAYKNSMYKVPRGTTLEELSKKMRIKKSAFREHLKRAEAKVIREYFEK